MRTESLVRQVQTAATDAERRQAFDVLVVRFQEQAERWARQHISDPAAAQDAAQEAFITAYEHLDQLREPEAFPAWLRRIVASQCARITRRRDHDQPSLDEEQHADPTVDPVDAIERAELAREVRRALDRLPEHERYVTELFYLTGYSQQEIAERLALPLTTVKKRLQYARERMRETMTASVAVQSYLLLHTGIYPPFDGLDRLFEQVRRMIPVSPHFYVIA